MSYAHILQVYEDSPRVKVVFCTVCRQDSDLSKPCPGEYKMSKKEQQLFDNQFRSIFGGVPVKPSKNKMRCT